MEAVEEVKIDVRDIDYTWFEGVRAYLDRELSRYFLPRESVDRLGEVDPDTGAALLIDGHVEARADEVTVDGVAVPAWSIGCADLVVRPARAQL